MKTESVGKQLGIAIRPFIMLPPCNPSDVDVIIDDIAKAIDAAMIKELSRLQEQIRVINNWHVHGKFTFDGLTYTKGINDYSAQIIIDKFLSE